MKLILFFFCSIYAFCQDHGFSVDNNNIVWQKVFNEARTPNDLAKSILLRGHFDFVDASDKEIHFRLNYTKLDFKAYGYNPRDSRFLTVGGACTGVILFKENSYKVIILKTELNPVTDNQSFEPLNASLLKDGKLRTTPEAVHGLGLFNSYFTDIFSAKPVKTEW